MRRIAIINQKGGVGKTTTTVNIGVALARAGHRVLLIDLDPQAHLTLHLGQDPGAGQLGTYELLTGSASFAKARRKAGQNLWLVGSSIDLAGAEVELVSVVGREVILRDLLDQHVGAGRDHHRPQYDYVLIDCPPSLGVLTLNGLCAAGEVFIPLQPHYLALQGLGKLLETISLVNKRINPGLLVSGVVLCMYDAGTKLAGEVVQDVRTFFGEAKDQDLPWRATRIFDTVIRRNIKLAEAPSYGQSIFDYAPDSNGAKDYARLAAEIHAPPAVLHSEESPEAAAPEAASPQEVAPPEPPVQPEEPPPPSLTPPLGATA
ncbi:MAG: ParA family protein [Phycisphaerales bacterium]|nr:ParA family protein [Phycisphaerales bacterium]